MQENKMGTMPIDKLIISMSLPIMISMLVQALYNIVDSIFVAQISENALTAVSMAFPIQNLMIAVGVGTAVGVNALLARSLGERDFDKVNKIAENAVFLVLLSYLLFLIIGLFFAEPFFRSQTDIEEIVLYGKQYLTVCCCLSFGCFTQLMFERMLQATGKTVYTMITQTTGAVINIILDPILIFGWFGLPEIGVAGAAIATVIGQFCAMLIGYVITKVKIKELDIHMHNFSFSIPILCKIYKVGVPAILMQSVLSFMTVFMNMILAPISAMAITVFSVYYKLQNFLNMAVLGITNALIPIVAYNNGANRKDRAIEAIQFSMILSIFIMAVGTIVFQLFPKQLLAMFSANDQMYGLGIPALKIISLSFVFAGISMVLCAAFQALNKANTSLVITLARQLVILIPLTYGLMKCFGIQVGWYAFVVTEFMCAMYSLFEWRKMKR